MVRFIEEENDVRDVPLRWTDSLYVILTAECKSGNTLLAKQWFYIS
jgi:hypothetical protein